MTEIAITEEQFKEIFKEEDHDLYYLLTTEPKTVEELKKYYLPSKLWRINNLYTIIDKDGEHVPFKMNLAQFKVYAAFLHHSRLLILKSRQQGISTFWLIFFFDDAIFQSHLNVGLMAQGADEAATLLERVKFSWEHLPNSIVKMLGRKKTKDNTKEYSFNNNSTIFIRTSFRSATLQRLHISEYAKICNASPQRARETKTGTLQTIKAGNPVIIETTGEGINDFNAMWNKAVAKLKDIMKAGGELAGKDFYPLFLPWIEDPTCVEPIDQVYCAEAMEYFTYLEQRLNIQLTREQKNFWQVQFEELDGDIYQEYPATPEEAFRASRDGTYWAKLYNKHIVMKHRIRKNLLRKRLPVYIAVDIGKHDYMVFTFFQIVDNKILIIGEFWHHGESLKYYCDYLNNTLDKDIRWQEGVVYLPHDAGVEDISRDDGLTREEVFHSHGVTNTVVLDKGNIADDIEAVREAIPSIYMDVECQYLESCFLNYAKEFDEKIQIFVDRVKKSKFNHGADTIRYMVRAYFQYHYIKPPQEQPDPYDDYTDSSYKGGLAL